MGPFGWNTLVCGLALVGSVVLAAGSVVDFPGWLIILAAGSVLLGGLRVFVLAWQESRRTGASLMRTVVRSAVRSLGVVVRLLFA